MAFNISFYYSIPCTLSNTYRPSCQNTIENFRQIYCFLASNDETCHLFRRFSLWPIIFIPRDRTTGDFVFSEKTFWNDLVSQLSLPDTITSFNGRISIQPYYKDDAILSSFFRDVLRVEFNPTTDDYLPLLSSVEDINKTWQLIKIITGLAMEQNKQEEVQGKGNCCEENFKRSMFLLFFCSCISEKCLDISFIPCMSNEMKRVKYTDHPLYPHDAEIATLFSNHLLIIKLPGKLKQCNNQ